MLLGITVESDLKFYKPIYDLCNKVSKKINALCRVTGYMSLEKRRIVMKTIVESQFNYYTLTWMLHARTFNNKLIVFVREASELFILIMNHHLLLFLKKYGSFSIHHRNIQSLATEIYKFLHDLSPTIMGDILKLKRPPTYNLRTR